MQIVIDIPDEMYKEIKETFKVLSGSRRSERFDYILFNAVNTGTPLPKGHGRLIDVNEIPIDCDYYDVENAPTIIEADKGGEK